MAIVNTEPAQPLLLTSGYRQITAELMLSSYRRRVAPV
jgi:hypothetical protein